MEQKRITIYETEDMKIEIDQRFHSLIQRLHVPQYKLPITLKEFLISGLIEDLHNKRLISENVEILLGNAVLVLLSGEEVSLRPPLDGLTDIVNYMLFKENDVLSPDFKEQLLEFFADRNVIFGTFPYAICGVSGYVGEETDEGVLLLFFSYEKEETE